ncbi:MAG: TonB-dependent receptor [Saprospiraceae bacterium]|nr:TonB-dependent receptor [Saprospiraceae bacterium]
MDDGQTAALNEMASATARSFSVEQTQRYAASVSDPSRMVQSYAGVFNGGDDLSNEIITRGNSARGMLWRLEGVDIPSPNHFGGLGAGGGSISMLTSIALARSDFYTGAFPAEFGNALSGVFDLRMRKGNPDKREHHIGIGNLGLDVSTEGYFKKGSGASYLINYRYATLQWIDKYLTSLGRLKPSYQDLSFKVHVPTEKLGTFSLFGLGGKNSEVSIASRTPSTWQYADDSIDFHESQQLGVVGLNHRYLLSDKSYLSSSLSLSGYQFRDLTEVISASDFSTRNIDESAFDNINVVGSIELTHRFNRRQLFRAGASLNRKWFSYDYQTQIDDQVFLFLGNDGRADLFQSFAQWRTTLDQRWKINYGAHFSYLFLNETSALDPRVSVDYTLDNHSIFSLASGLYSRSEHPSTYFIERVRPDDVIEEPNKSLPFTRAFHVVGGYQTELGNRVRLKTELYYQYLFHVPVSGNEQSTYSVLNSSDLFDIIFDNDSIGSILVAQGAGKNYGFELTIERPLANGMYLLGTLSLFDALYKTRVNRYLPARFANNRIGNLLVGKEWSLGRKKNHFLMINARLTYADGNRVFPVDLEASRSRAENVYQVNEGYQGRTRDYFRFDFGLAWRINLFNATHTISLDVQNMTDRMNVLSAFMTASEGSLLRNFKME